MSQITIFASIDSFLENNMDAITETVSEVLSSQVSTLFTASITLYVLFYGYMVLAGKIEAPVSDLIWNLAKFALLITFINNVDGWLDLTKESIKSLSEITGTRGLGFLDTQFSQIGRTTKFYADKADWGLGWVVAVLIWAGFLLSCIPAVLLIVINKVSMYFLLALLPLFIFCLMWGWLKESFNQYLSAILSNALVIVVVTVFLEAINNFLYEATLSGTLNSLMVAMSYVVIGLFGAALVKYLASQASNLMRVSIEKLPQARSNPGSPSKPGSGGGGGGDGGGGDTTKAPSLREQFKNAQGVKGKGKFIAQKGLAPIGKGAYSLIKRGFL